MLSFSTYFSGMREKYEKALAEETKTPWDVLKKVPLEERRHFLDNSIRISTEVYDELRELERQGIDPKSAENMVLENKFYAMALEHWRLKILGDEEHS